MSVSENMRVIVDLLTAACARVLSVGVLLALCVPSMGADLLMSVNRDTAELVTINSASGHGGAR